MSVHVLGQVFAVNMPLSRLLQTEIMDLCEAISLAEQQDATLKAMQTNTEDGFHKLFGSIQAIRRFARYSTSCRSPNSTNEPTCQNVRRLLSCSHIHTVCGKVHNAGERPSAATQVFAAELPLPDAQRA